MKDRDSFVKRYFKRIERADLFHDAVATGLVGAVLRNECPKQPIPDDQDSAVVPIQIARINRMVDPVMGRCVEEKFDRLPQSVDSFGVKPELVDEAHSHLKYDHLRRKTDIGE